jgi:hypothetical protein
MMATLARAAAATESALLQRLQVLPEGAGQHLHRVARRWDMGRQRLRIAQVVVHLLRHGPPQCEPSG